MYKVTKTYGATTGLSATFRQWKATSHCRFIHGYALGVRLTICAQDANLDENGWVFNFGALKPFKAWLESKFDHKTLVALDDPALPLFREMAASRQAKRGDELKTNWDEAGQLIQLVEVERTGCEGFAKMIYNYVWDMLNQSDGDRIWLESVEVFEHEGNAAIYCGEGR